MIKIYYDNFLNKNVIEYTFIELFRYIDNSILFIDDKKEAHILYSHDSFVHNNQLKIEPSKLFWNNYGYKESLPISPLKIVEDIIFIYNDDIIASSFFLLSGYEELLNTKRDKYNRFLHKYSYYKTDGIYKKPLVEIYRKVLVSKVNDIGKRSNIKKIFKKNNFGLFLTHDVDGVYKYRNTIKSVLKIILRYSNYDLQDFIRSKKNIVTLYRWS